MQKLKRIVIKEELLALCDGNFNEALVLDQLIFWQGIVNENDREIQEQIDKKKKLDLDTQSLEKKLRHGWFWKTAQNLSEEIMNYRSEDVIRTTLRKIESKHFIESRNKIRGPWDNTKGYRVNLEYIQQELQKLGFSLEGYSLSKNSEAPSRPNPYFKESETYSKDSSPYSKDSNTENKETVTVSNFSNQTSENNSLNIYQSKKEEISKIDLPPKVELVCHKLIDRLIDDNINLGDIKAQFNTYKLLIKHESEEEYQDFFATYLERVLYATKGTIRNIKSLIDTAIKKDFQEGSITVYKNPNAKQEVLPEWFKKQKQQEAPEQENQEQSESPEQIQKEKEELQKSIKARSQKRKQESLT